MKKVLDKSVRKIKTHFIVTNLLTRILYKVMCKSMVKPERPQMTVLYGAEKMIFACLITKARI